MISINNVISFPKQKKDSSSNSMDQDYKKDHIEHLIDDVLSDAFISVRAAGFDMGEEKCIKTTALVIESLRSALYKSAGIFHPLHPVAEMMFDTNNTDPSIVFDEEENT